MVASPFNLYDKENIFRLRLKAWIESLTSAITTALGSLATQNNATAYVFGQATTSGTTQTVSSIASSSQLLILIGGIGHSSGSPATLTLELSDDNGATWGTPVNVSGAVAASVALQGTVLVTGTQAGQAKGILPNVGESGVAATYRNFGIESVETGAINTIRLAWGGATFDAGAVYVYRVL